MQNLCAFVSDSHLAPSETERADAFAGFVRQSASAFDPLVLVGDIFDLWLGPSFLGYPAYKAVAESFAFRGKRGKRTIFITGNRDFLFDAATARNLRLELAGDAAVVEVGGRRALATHGDLLCSRDWRYQIYRRFVRAGALKRFANNLPRGLAFLLGSLMQSGSRLEKSIKDESSMDLDAATVSRFLSGRDARLPGDVRRSAPRDGFDAIVCGHIHAGRILRDCSNGRARTLVTLPTWSPGNPGVAWDGETFSEIPPMRGDA